jgi:predicted secreted hydrolase
MISYFTVFKRLLRLPFSRKPIILDRFTAVRPDPVRDQGAHDHPMEWWYLNGRFRTAAGEFSFAGAIFQIRLLPEAAYSLGYLHREPIFVGHYSLTDITQQRFTMTERSTLFVASNKIRTRIGEARRDSLAVTLGDWTLSGTEARYQASFNHNGSEELRLEMTSTKHDVIHGDGWSGTPEIGRMYYYSATRLSVEGTLNGSSVSGIAWLDHQWGGNDLGGLRDGVFLPHWDWFSLQLEDGRDIMAYRIRNPEGQVLEVGASITDLQSQTWFDHHAVLEPGETWLAPSGARYPLRWQLTLANGEKFMIAAVMEAQEIDSRQSVGHRYYEGATNITGAMLGTGFMELAGYTRMVNLLRNPLHWLLSQVAR